jgi:YD repeat-containing protein
VTVEQLVAAETYGIVREYRFTYGDYQPSEDTDQHIRLLTGITEYGQGATTALPTTEFTYTAAVNKVQCSGCSGEWRNLTFAYPRLDEIENGYGAKTTVSYETPDAPKASDYKYDRTYNYRVYSSTIESGLGDGSEVVYSYPTATSGRAYQLDPTSESDFYASGGTTGGTLIGYRAVTETLRTLAGNPLAVTGHSFTLDILPADLALRGLETETRQYDTQGTMLAKTVMTWAKTQTVALGEGNTSDSARNAYSSYLAEVREYYRENAGFPADDSPQKATVYQYTLQTAHYYGSGSQTYAYVSDWSHLTRVDEKDHGTVVRSTLYEYAPNGALVNWVGQTCTDLAITDPGVCPWLTNLVSQEIVTDTSGTVSGTRYYYDGHATHTITPTHGILTKVEQLSADDTTWVTTQQLGYSTATVSGVTVTYGPTQLVDARGYTTTIAYDIARRDPVTVTNVLGQTTAYEYDPLLGLVTRVQGPNGAATATEYVFDDFGRLTAIVGPGDSAAYPTTAITYEDDEAPWRIVQEARQESGTADTVATAVYYDGLGRAVQTQVLDTARETATVTDQAYNALGLVAGSWPAYITDTVGSDYLPLDDARAHTAYTYDALGRVTSATAPDATTTSTAYNGLRTAMLDANGHQTIQTYDGLGRLARVDSYTAVYSAVDWDDPTYVSSVYGYNGWTC